MKIVMTVCEKYKDIIVKKKLVFPAECGEIDYNFMFDYKFVVDSVDTDIVNLHWEYLGFKKDNISLKKHQKFIMEQQEDDYSIKVVVKFK